MHKPFFISLLSGFTKTDIYHFYNLFTSFSSLRTWSIFGLIITTPMKTLDAVHHHHTELSNEILFLKKEIDFLLKILRNCYSSSVQADKIKLMDSYWKSFDQNKEKLDHLLDRIELEEKKNTNLYKNNPKDSLVNDQKESEFNRVIETVQFETKLIKESFYEFMHGCNACALKTH